MSSCRFFKCFTAFGLCLFGLGINAAAAGSLESRYGLYIGGIRLGAGAVQVEGIDEGAHAFHLKGNATTAGMLSSLYNWNAQATSDGTFSQTHYKLDAHSWTTDDRGREKVVTLHWDGKGVSSADYNPSLSSKYLKKAVPQNLRNGTVDPVFPFVTAGLNQKTLEGVCDKTYAVFDGKRRFDLIFRPVGEVALPKSNYNAYQGKAFECAVDFKPISGFFRQEAQQKALEKGEMLEDRARVWYGFQKSQKNMVLVRARFKTPLGVAFVHIKTR